MHFWKKCGFVGVFRQDYYTDKQLDNRVPLFTACQASQKRRFVLAITMSIGVTKNEEEKIAEVSSEIILEE